MDAPKVIYLFDNYQEYEAATRNHKASTSNDLKSSSVDHPYVSSTNYLTACSNQLPEYFISPYIVTHSVYVYQNRDYNNNPSSGLLLNYKAGTYNYLYDLCLPDLTSVNGSNWSDIITSLRIDNRCDGSCTDSSNRIRLELFEHVNYGGKAIAFSASPGTESNIASLSNYSMGTFSSWNDKASSLKVLHQYAW